MPQKQTHQIAIIALRSAAQRVLRARLLGPGAIPRHRGEFRQQFVHEPADIGKCVPWARRCLCGTDGSGVASILLTTDWAIACRPPGTLLNLGLQSIRQQLD
jgi:hypothetical protein